MVYCPHLSTQALHINDNIQWFQICDSNACVLRCTLHDHYKAHKPGSIEQCHLCEHSGYCDTNVRYIKMDIE